MADQIMRAGTETAAIVPEIWSSRFYDVLRASLPFLSSVSMDYENEIQDLGDVVNVPTLPDFSEASVVAEDARADAEAVTVTSQQLVINSRVVKDAIVTKQSQLQSIEFMDKMRDAMIYSINKKMHSLIIAAIIPSASAPDHAIAYDSGTTLALADILEAKELLDLQNVPSMDRVMVPGVAQANDMFNITGFVSRDFTPSGSPLTTGEFPTQVLGFSVKPTTEASNTTYLFHPSFLTMAVQDQLNIMVYDLGVDGKRASRVNADVLMGYKQLDNKRVVSIS